MTRDNTREGTTKLGIMTAENHTQEPEVEFYGPQGKGRKVRRMHIWQA